MRAGKVHYIGVSNVLGWQLQKIVDLNKKFGYPQIVSLQVPINVCAVLESFVSLEVCVVLESLEWWSIHEVRL